MRSLLIAGLFSLLSLLCFSQTDTAFWFVAPEVAYAHGDRPIYLRMTSFDVSANVTISEPANASFTPIQITIPAFDTYTVDLTSFIDMVEDKPSDQVNNYGLHIQASNQITVYYDEDNSYNMDLFTLKGKNALGTTFYIPSQNDFPNDPRFLAYNSFDIIATEDNTIVQITPSNDIVGHTKLAGTFTIVLNKGQTYCAQAVSQSPSDHLMGSKVVSNKPVAITFKDDSVNISGGADLSGDQIVPVKIIGNEYIIVRGYLDSSVNDRVYVLSASDQNNIYLNGSTTPVATLNTGMTYSFSITVTNPVAFLVSDKPVYVQHLTGYGFESGSALLPPIKCTGSLRVAFTRSTTNSFTLTLVTLDGAQGSFNIDGNTTLVTASQFQVVPGTTNPVMVYARISFTAADLPVGPHIIYNTSDYFSLGMINFSAGNIGCSYGYFSDYARLNLGPDFSMCPGKTAVLNAGPGWDSYLWSTGQTTQSITISSAGTYWVTTSDPLCTLSDTVRVFALPVPIPTISGPSSACVGSTGNVYTTESSMSGYSWNISAGGSITSGLGTNTVNVTWNAPGSQTLSVIYTNSSGCTAYPATVKGVSVNSLPYVALTACFDTITTVDALSFLLRGGVPPGGTFSGPGVNSVTGYFDPGQAGTGSKIVTYTYQDQIHYCSNTMLVTIHVLSASNLNCGQLMTDVRDGKTYPTVLIGTQCWMQKNLDYGTMISSSLHQTDNCIIEKYCYNDIPSNCSSYGGYYQWDEIMQYNNTPGSQGICPPGWHIPLESELMTLINNNNGNGQAADSLKHTFITSFNALLAGNLYQNIIWKNLDFATFFWTSSPYSSFRSIARGMNDPDISVSYYPALRSNAFFLRCLKD